MDGGSSPIACSTPDVLDRRYRETCGLRDVDENERHIWSSLVVAFALR